MEYIINGKIKQIQVFNKIFLYFLYGALWSFSQVGYSFAFLTWFTLTPFIFTIKYEDNKFGFFYAWIFGSAVYLFHLWWMISPVFNALTMDKILPFYGKIFFSVLSFFIFFLVSAYHGLMYGAIFAVCKYVAKNNTRIFYFAFPITATVIDYYFPKLWYDQIGYSQYLFFHFSQIADLFGVSGITFLIMLCNTVVIMIIETFLYRKHIRIGIISFTVMIILIISSSLYGLFRYKNYVEKIKSMDTVKIGLIQGNYYGFEKEDKSKVPEMIEKYNNLSAKILIQKPDLIVWPETAIPYKFVDSIPYFFKIDDYNFSDIKKFSQSPLLTGTHLIDFQNDKLKIYNSMVLINEKGRKIYQYNKEKLLPFVEDSPIPVFNVILNVVGYQNFTKGENNQIMKIGKIKAFTNICYEAIIPDFVRKKTGESNVIINLTDDSWYGKTIEPKMHLVIAGFRAIENRRALVRSTPTGYSAVFSPSGDVVYESALYTEDSAVVNIALSEDKTVYQRFGYLFIRFLALILLLLFFFSFYKKALYKNNKAAIIKNKIHKKNLNRMWID